MVHITYKDEVIEVASDQTALEALLAAGHEIPNSCRAGTCQSCMMQIVSGDVPAAGQKGLKSTLVAQGYFLPCCSVLEADLEVTNSPLVTSTGATVVEKEWMSDSVVRLKLDAELSYRAGQFVELKREDGLVRSYSLASVPSLASDLEFHIRIHPEGKFSSWLQGSLEVGGGLTVTGPLGDCFYTADDLAAPILLAGTGTGLAPLIGIAKDALTQGHSGPVHLFIAGRTEASLYGLDELAVLSETYENFNYTPVVLSIDLKLPEGGVEGDINLTIKEHYSSLKGFKVYLCGAASRVNKLKRDCYIRGASMKDIHCDAFTPAVS